MLLGQGKSLKVGFDRSQEVSVLLRDDVVRLKDISSILPKRYFLSCVLSI